MEIVLAAMVVLAVLIVGGLAFAQAGEPPAPGAVAPDFRLQGIDGSELSLAGLRGSRTVLVFHPQDDTPECLAVVQRVTAVARDIEASGARLATVVVSTREAAQAYAAAHSPGLPVLCDTDGRVTRSYGSLVNLGFMKFARKLVVLVDAKGKVERVWRDAVGPGTVDDVLALLSGTAR